MNILKLSIIAVAFCLFAKLNAGAQAPSNGEELIVEMHSAHSANWYEHITFKQEMYWYKQDSLLKNEVWIVAYSAPSMLHIRYKDFDSGRGWIVANDTLYAFNHNKLIGKRPRLHTHIALGFDVYFVAPEVMIPRIEKMGFNLMELAIVEINGHEVYQVGNPATSCFWVHPESLLFYGVRSIDESGVKDTFFEKYKQFYGKPVATQVQYFQDGNLYLFEKYFEIRLPSIFPKSYFNPNEFVNTRW